MSTAAPPDGFSTLYRDHHRWLHGWLRRKLNCTEQAADLAQDTFVRLLSRPEPEGLREPRAYLATIAHGLVVNHWRRKALEQAYLEELASRPEVLAPSPEERRLVVEALEEIARLLDGLPARVREIFLLSQLDGLTYAAIGERLGVSINVVQKAMVRATAHCYRALYR
ncbi:sigma-70 family RNA polymerase sigma factor [Pseudothauera nasutitermitis]|uniref:Sigma-70 family RNA polymerase sigma factor n=1 Tax=Pseudothauera nasutitermitis TaxID=2565930 RepID=A0A4S4B0U3_9RHOO|nr:sigma-70 family RNA polymerase sigma factor [Pseudothauera nasutitermitis]THF66161.1 sigma-70 family RNA polymerase sigma factor [Pseudothauera nasutitermitis]